jgi:hypothetical protein
MFLSMCDVKVSDIYFTEFGTALTTILPILFQYFINTVIVTTGKIIQQPENCENRKDPDLVQAFLKKWWVASDIKATNLPLSLRFKGSGCHYNSIYKILEQNR